MRSKLAPWDFGEEHLMVDPRVEPLTQQLLRDGYFDCESDAKRAATRILLAAEDVFDDPPEFPAQSAINEP